MAKNRKGKSRKTVVLNVKHEAMFNALFTYAGQILENKKNDPTYILDSIVEDIAIKVDRHFNVVTNSLFRKYGLVYANKVESYLQNEILDVIKTDVAGPKKLRVEMMLILTLDYLFNKVKHPGTIKAFSPYRHRMEATITLLNNIIVNAKIISYNYDAIEIMVGAMSGPLVFKDTTLGAKVKQDLKYKSTVLFTLLPLWVEELTDKPTIDAIESCRGKIAELTTAFNDVTRMDKTALHKYITDELMEITVEDEKPINGLVIIYGILGFLSSVKHSNIFRAHFGDLDLTNIGNEDLNDKVVANNIGVIIDKLKDYELTY